MSSPIDFTRSAQEYKSAGPAADDPFNILVERSGTSYNVSWNMEKPSQHVHVKRYAVKWYDMVDGKELGSEFTAANKRHLGEKVDY